MNTLLLILPVAGDGIASLVSFGNLFFEADTRNVRLLVEYADPNTEHTRSTARHWAAVLGLAGIFIAVLVLLGAAVVTSSVGLVNLSHGR